MLERLPHVQGSSPRMRGTPICAVHIYDGVGIIPAYAGNTLFCVALDTLFWDHPRVCGEHIVWVCHASSCLGSSPRMRGTLSWAHTCRPTPGIIPAYAGNTVRALTRPTAAWDHPRVCGEHTCGIVEQGTRQGSSPRMRGTPVSIGLRAIRLGIIPAYAGNTSSRTADGGHQRDHPRVCGEHHGSESDSEGLEGSSPRMRGTRGAEFLNAA